jgi:hypothetical protein
MEIGQDSVALAYRGRLRSDDIPMEPEGRKRNRDAPPPDIIPLPETTTNPAEPAGDAKKQPAARFDIRCHRCMKIGHKAKDCAEEAVSISRCYKCGEAGHTARQCRVKGSLDQFGPRRFEARRIALREAHQRPNNARTHEALDAQLAAYGGDPRGPASTL